ncbi:hypothetical protein LIER_06721 [Lithospermum erythrorhizon]|uniref:LPXTG cell wall anchor domain-containing protein n=1 Tax=Lithospermum erythrorhizon TaxID=34254 RepID=A0AAV3P6K7_LITER
MPTRPRRLRNNYKVRRDVGPIVNPCCRKAQLQGGAGSNNNVDVPHQPSPLSSKSKHRSPPIDILAPESSTVTVSQATHGGAYLLVFLLLGLFYFIKKNRKNAKNYLG